MQAWVAATRTSRLWPVSDFESLHSNRNLLFSRTPLRRTRRKSWILSQRRSLSMSNLVWNQLLVSRPGNRYCPAPHYLTIERNLKQEGTSLRDGLNRCIALEQSGRILRKCLLQRSHSGVLHPRTVKLHDRQWHIQVRHHLPRLPIPLEEARKEAQDQKFQQSRTSMKSVRRLVPV